MRFRILSALGFLIFAISGYVSARESRDDLVHFSSRQEEALVVKVPKSDVIILEDGRKVHLIGIESADPPPRKTVELDKNGKIIEQKENVAVPLEEQAVIYAQDLLENKKIKLKRRRTDRAQGAKPVR